jgi:glucosamine-phosphate N-acetyltransferase
MIFRKLHNGDYEKFIYLIRDFRETAFSEAEFIHTLHNIQKNADIWVIEIDGCLIATATIIYEHKFIFNTCILAHIEDVCVKKEYRRKGFGQLIVKHLITEASSHKCYKVTLDCADDNVPFYESCGFEKRGNQLSQLIKN